MSGEKVLVADLTYHQGALHEGLGVRLAANGTIAAVAPADQLEGPRILLSQRVLVPGLVNAHSHCWQVLLRGLGRDPVHFAAWVAEQLYPTVERLDVELFEAAARLCFAQMLQCGVTTCGEFHYVHRGPEGEDVEDAYDLAVLRAARAVGIRLVLARTMYDQGERPGQRRFQETPEEAAAALRRLHAAVADDPLQSVLPAPHSLHGASRDMLLAAHECAIDLDTRLHIHLAEQQSDLPFSEERYQASPLRALEGLGMLDERLTLVHGIWLDEGEITMLGATGGGLVYNPGTNMLLADGTAPIPAFLEAGVRVGLGSDANLSPDVLAELRAAEFLQRIRSLEMNRIAPTLGEGEGLLDLATAHGAECLGLDSGAIEAGRPADLVALRLDVPSMAPGAALGPEAVLHQLCFAARPLEAVDRVWVQGELVADRGRPSRVSLIELAAEVSAGAAARLAG